MGSPADEFAAKLLGQHGCLPAQTVVRHRYYAALGRFVDSFSVVEAQMHLLLQEHAGVTDANARALFSGVKIDAARDFINRIYDANGRERDPILTRAFEQLGVITKARNDVIHLGARFEPSAVDMYVTNAHLAHVQGKVAATRVSPDILDKMSEDLSAILCALTLNLVKQWEASEIDTAFMSECAQSSWRYKPERIAPPRPATDQPRSPQRHRGP